MRGKRNGNAVPSYVSESKEFIPPWIWNMFSPPVYMFTVVGCWYYGTFEVLPYQYGDSRTTLVFVSQCFTNFVFVQMMVNWLCTRYVSSEYRPKEINNQTDGRDDNNQSGDRPRGNCVQQASESHTTTTINNIYNMSKNDDYIGSSRQRGKVSYVKEGDNTVKVVTYPYWSWKPCIVCNVERPPRCHHCPLCKKCFLKRDHHCFFTGSCVGWRNYRFFLVFCFWASIATTYATVHSVFYFWYELWPTMAGIDVLLPVVTVKWILGYSSLSIFFLVSLGTFLLFFTFESTFFFKDHVTYAVGGVTSFESTNLTKSVRIVDDRDFHGKMRSIFGKYWAVNIIFPLHWLFEPMEDATNWPRTRACI